MEVIKLTVINANTVGCKPQHCRFVDASWRITNFRYHCTESVYGAAEFVASSFLRPISRFTAIAE